MDVYEIQRLANAVIDAANEQTEREPELALREALGAVQEHEHGSNIRTLIIAELPRINAPAGAGFLAVWFGASVENGADPEHSLPAIWETFLRWCGELERIYLEHEKQKPQSSSASSAAEDESDADEDDDADIDADDDGDDVEIPEELDIGLEYLGQSIVAHLAHSESSRLELAAQADVHDLLERASGFSVGPIWVLELLRRCSGSVLVFHIESRRGFRVRYNNLSNCFHLFTLLQCALSKLQPNCRKPTEEMLRVAAGEFPEDGSDDAWWHYGSGRSPRPDMMESIWGEGSPAAIPEVRGEAVILLWPPILQGRSWNAGFFGPPLHAAPASLTVQETLSEELVQEWWKILNLDSAPDVSVPKSNRPWWKFWQT